MLEITFLTNEDEMIFNCKKNRQGVWVSAVVAQLKQALKLVETA